MKNEKLDNFWKNNRFYEPSEKLARKIIRRIKNDPDWNEGHGETSNAKEGHHTLALLALGVGAGNYNIATLGINQLAEQREFIETLNLFSGKSPKKESEISAEQITRLQSYLKKALYGYLAAVFHSRKEKKNDVDLNYVFGGYFVHGLGITEPDLVNETSDEFINWLENENAGIYDAVWGRITRASGENEIDLTKISAEDAEIMTFENKGEIFKVPLE